MRNGEPFPPISDNPLGPAPMPVQAIENPTAKDYLRDLYGFVMVSSAVNHLAGMGIHILNQQLLANWNKYPENPDPLIHFVNGDPNEISDPVAAATMTMQSSNAIRITRALGPAWDTLTHQYVISLYAHWDEVTRPGLHKTLGLAKEQTQIDYFGDLRIYRNHIAHSGAILSENGNRQLKLMTWFNPGDPISFSFDQRAQLLELFPWPELLELVGGGPLFEEE